jgi:hypothetical protein
MKEEKEMDVKHEEQALENSSANQEEIATPKEAVEDEAMDVVSEIPAKEETPEAVEKEEIPAQETIAEPEPLEVETTEAVGEESPSIEIQVVEASEVKAEETTTAAHHEFVDEHEDDDHEEEETEKGESESALAEAAQEIVALPKLEDLEPEELLALALKVFQDEPLQRIGRKMDEISQVFFAKLKEIRDEKLHAFKEENGDALDFEWEHPLRQPFKELINNFRKAREKFQKELDEVLQANLSRREQLIEQLKELIHSREEFHKVIDQFKAIQEAWREAGQVPRTASSDLWRNYHFHLENFYDYLDLNKEFRDLHFQKNLEFKEDLIKRAEALLEKTSIKDAFRELQSLHKIWKEESGPVSPELREDVWQRFSAVSKKLHEKRQEYLNKVGEKHAANFALKSAICEKVEALHQSLPDSHKGWQELMETLKTINDEYRKIGRAGDKENQEVWERYRAALNHINKEKNSFYSVLKDAYKENLHKRQELIEKAESLMDSNDWKATTDALKKLQREWKEIGPVPAKLSRKTWDRFQKACNGFFARMKEHREVEDLAYEENYQQKEQLLAELEALQPTGNMEQDKSVLKELMTRWRAVGFVPRSKMGIENNFQKLLNLKMNKLGGKGHSDRVRFETKVEILQSQGNRKEISSELSQLMRRMREAEDELKQMEANSLMFTNTGNKKNPMLEMIEKKIEQQRDILKQLREQKKMMDLAMRPKPAAEESTEEPAEPKDE